MSKRVNYFLRRVLEAGLILWAISILAFTIIHLAPGGPVAVFEDPLISPEAAQRINAAFGLYDPVPIQYIRWLTAMLHGEFGRSFVDSRPVIDRILERLPATLELNIVARLLGLLGIPLGVIAAANRGRWADRLATAFSALGSAAPQWWIGLMILVFVAAPTGLFPLGGIATIGKPSDLVDRLWHLLLPAMISAVGDWIVWSRYVRSQVLEVLHQDYVRTAYAKGLGAVSVFLRHILPNALIPAITILGDIWGTFISGSVVLETVFSWPGIGRLAFLAAMQRDYPTVMALLMITASLVVFGNLLSDALYTLADPRISLK